MSSKRSLARSLPSWLGWLVLSAGLLGWSGAALAAGAPAGFAPLFNGHDLAGWRGGVTHDHRELLALPEEARAALIVKWTASLTEMKDGRPHWRVEEGVLVNDGFGGYATTVADYGDFELRLEYRIAPGTDSGVYLRGVPQVQIWDPHAPDPKGHGNALGSGGLWNNAAGSPGRNPLVRADRPVGEWNQLRVLMVGSRVSVWLNEVLVVNHARLENYFDRTLPGAKRRPVPRRGPIQLQTHGGETRWRNVYIREVGPAEANRILASHDLDGYSRIFNGRDLQGWGGAVDVAEVQGETLTWKKGMTGNLCWNTELDDFQVRLLFKLPPAGNNGLAIRYPGEGAPAYDGMCEIQILDENYETNKPAKIDPRQAHGSAYGMVAAARGYQHPLGEWNFQEVTVQGSRIQVELNGTVILDTDLNEADPASFAGKRAHPGRSRTRGLFGFAGHNDPVAFKDIFLRRL